MFFDSFLLPCFVMGQGYNSYNCMQPHVVCKTKNGHILPMKDLNCCHGDNFNLISQAVLKINNSVDAKSFFLVGSLEEQVVMVHAFKQLVP